MQRLLNLLALASLLCAATALAQTFPSRPIRILVPSVAGSSPDIRARQIAREAHPRRSASRSSSRTGPARTA